ncbi:hypothetical protein EXIGLDRAFT_640506 [Exidia glandulosa HHB12029]|uniref:Uncharacterized protein n=1 Tax=Exidia glandulosa HHB12029 TaxID=1314781 RepID=A0A165MNG1_EXIGL|nr:hypothetical protein EXIGLDRAFT_640506 [Exidia glandulosa HHB12029]
MTTPSVVEVRRRIAQDPFIWPRLADVQSFRAMLQRGNARPSPGPDGWEKWCVKALSDTALTRVVALHNYEVAAQQGVQTRDLTSFLAGVQCWAFRHKVTVYALQRDQMKGFDYLAPEGFYDAVRAYGLPESIIKLDQSAQARNRCFIRTAYGFTDPIVVDGVTKQGASLSPTKSAFTTSLGHRYIDDLCIQRPGVLTLQTKMAESGDHHTPADRLALTVTMVEATDDSYIFATKLDTLDFICLTLERFQYVYGWLTQWAKSRGYIIGAVPANPPATFRLGSVTTDAGVDPMTVSKRDVAVVTDGLYFMNTKINDSAARAELVRSIIDNFSLPSFSVRAPLTVIRRAFEQQVMSKIRAVLTMQPVTATEATALDSKVMSRVHQMMTFRYCPSSTILTLPVGLHGLGWTSIARLNASLAVEGLARDLNHHVPAYRTMANITLADWTCERNDCVYPFDAVGLKKTIHSNSKNSLPIAWIVAHDTMRTMRPTLHLRRTDVSWVLDGDVSLTHALKVAKAVEPTRPQVGATATAVLRRRGIQTLADCGAWVKRGERIEFAPLSTYPRVQSGRADPGPARWQEVAQAIAGLPISAMFDGPVDLLVTRDLRRRRAEEYIRAVARLESLPAAQIQDSPTTMWATDGSMVPASAARHQERSVAAAVTGPATVVLKVKSRAASILHGEVMALVAAAVLSGDSQHRVLSDHQNSVRLLSDPLFRAGDDQKVRRANGRSYYRWLQYAGVEQKLPNVVYTRGHADTEEVESRFNTLADYYATRSQDEGLTIPDAPIPTFSMDEFTFHTDDDGWIEANIRAHVVHFLSLQTASDIGGKHRMATRLYDVREPPEYPYLKAYRAYSAVVQLYARSGQLPTATTIVARKDWDAGLLSEDCRMECGCSLETEYHVFVECPFFDNMRAEAGAALRKRLERLGEVETLTEDVRTRLLDSAEFFFSSKLDSWPLKSSQYWLGHVPVLDGFIPKDAFNSALTRRRVLHKIFTEWHYASIRLTGRIWGDFTRRTARRFTNEKRGPRQG